jgi:DNA-binding transcriptional regulator YiaG
MSNLGAVLKSEMTRLARKELRAQIDSLKKSNSVHRRDIADLKRQVAMLQRTVKGAAKARPAVSEAEDVQAGTRFVAKGLRSLRSRLGLSAADFGKLAGASGQSVYNWESGKTVPGKPQQAVLAGLRALGKREAHARIESLALAAPRRTGKRQ